MPRARGRRASGAALTAALWAVFSSSTAAAQQPQTAPPKTGAATAETSAPAPAVAAQGQGSAEVTLPAAAAPAPTLTPAPAPAAAAPPPEDAEAKPAGPTDHEQVVNRWGVGLLSAVELRPLLPGPAYPEQSLVVAMLGARTWLSKRVGFELGLGLNTVSGKRADDLQSRKDVPEPTTWGFAAHLGMPLSLYDDQHYQFMLLPEVNLGMAVGRTKDDPNALGDQAVRQRARLLGGGLRAGAEVQFGMIGLPMLALTGTVGLRLNYQQSSVEAAENGGVVTRTRSVFAASTSSFNDPWDLFVSSIAALYYFR
ncbi:MAG TPA: hypothetical protein VNG33_15090 [Polyangiaceae bacterium]|nr:hypothetical protein [Polyangiaceae bacterium]